MSATERYGYNIDRARRIVSDACEQGDVADTVLKWLVRRIAEELDWASAVIEPFSTAYSQVVAVHRDPDVIHDAELVLWNEKGTVPAALYRDSPDQDQAMLPLTGRELKFAHDWVVGKK